MEQQQQQPQQQQQQPWHSGVLNGIARLSDPRHRNERHKLIVDAYNMRDVDVRSLQHLVSFLDNNNDDDDSLHETVVITELVLNSVKLVSDPTPDGGVDVLRAFFARSSDTTLTKVTFHHCNFGSQQQASQLLAELLAAFQTNRTVTDLTIDRIVNLNDGAVLGNSLFGLMRNVPQLQRLACTYCSLGVDGVRAFQPGLQANRTLRELSLSSCDIRDEGIRLLANALVGNTTIEILDISHNYISSSNGLDDIRRILESTRLKTFFFAGNDRVFNDETATQRFTHILSRHEFLMGLNVSNCQLGDNGIQIIVDGLVGNAKMEVLDIRWNFITSVGLAHITRLLESTRLKTIHMRQQHVMGYVYIFKDGRATHHFVTTLQHKNASVEELPGIRILDDFPGNNEDSKIKMFANIENSLKRNRQLNRVNLLLAPPPPAPQQQQQPQQNAGTLMLKLSHKAIMKFANVPNNAGTSAIFKLFQARPQLLEKRLKRPTATVAATAPVSVSQEQKRRRL